MASLSCEATHELSQSLPQLSLDKAVILQGGHMRGACDSALKDKAIVTWIQEQGDSPLLISPGHPVPDPLGKQRCHAPRAFGPLLEMTVNSLYFTELLGQRGHQNFCVKGLTGSTLGFVSHVWFRASTHFCCQSLAWGPVTMC